MDTIYLIMEEEEREGGNGYWTEEVAVLEYGFFTDKDEAEEFALMLNLRAHNTREEARRKMHDNQAAMHATKEAQRQALAAAGLDTRGIGWSHDPGEFEPRTFDGTGDYSIVEVNRA